MTEIPTMTPTVALAGRRAVQLLRAWRRRDVAAMNAVMNEPTEGGDIDVLTMLLGWTSDLLDRFPPEAIDELLSDLAIEFGLQQDPS